jgi:hypothetical protein
MGFCPGTSVGAVAEGRVHAVFAILGMLAGAALFAEAYPHLEKGFLKMGNLGPMTLPGVLGVGPWPVIAVLAVIYILAFVFFEKKGL